MFETETESECCQESDNVDSGISDNEETNRLHHPLRLYL